MNAAFFEALQRGLTDTAGAIGALGDQLGCAVNRVDLVVAIVEEVANFLPRAGLGAGVFAA